MTQTQSLLVTKDALPECHWKDAELPELSDGQILLEVEKYALTANNITYAVVGDGFGYWNFFPSGDAAQGIVPVWGFAKVAASKHADIAEGARVYGYLPMASHLIVTPGQMSGASFVDTAEHRAGLALVYNQYHIVNDQSDEVEAHRALFQPLFTTSFLIEDMMREAGWHDAEALLCTSASSKTALALAAVAKNRSPQIKRIGLTSPFNRDFVEGTGLYDQVLTYDELGKAVSDMPTVSVDFAGNGKLLADIHAHWDENLKFSSQVGVTHISERGGAKDLKGPKPVLFFAPTAAETLIKSVGPAAFRAAVDEQFDAFVAAVGSSITVEHVSGADAIKAAYLEMLDGKVAPDRGLMCSLGE